MPFTVVYTGILAPVTPVETLLRAAAILKEQGLDAVQFEIIGDGPRRPYLESLAASLELARVRFRDSVPRTEIPAILEKASVGYYTLRDGPSFYTYGVAGKKIPEYLAAGLPVVFAASTSMDPIEEAKCGITVSPHDAGAVAEAIRTLYEMSPEERNAMGLNGCRYAEEDYSWDVLAERLGDRLQEVLVRWKKERR